MSSFLHFWKRFEERPTVQKEDMEIEKPKYAYARRNSAEGVDLGDEGQQTLIQLELLEPSLFVEVLPREIHFLILSFLQASDLYVVSQINKDFKSFVEDDLLWKRMYIKKWLSKATDDFIFRYFPRDFAWRNMYKTRLAVEKKYLHEVIDEMAKKGRQQNDKLFAIDGSDWRTFLRKGKLLAKYTTEDLEEFLLLASVEQEQYKSAAVLAALEKDKKDTADIYYYWGRCIKDLSRNKSGMEKHAYLLAEQEKYKTASLLEPKDSYILYSWAINLRFQLENLEGEEAVNVYRESSRRYRTALQYGYIEKYVLWGLGSLKLHMAKKQICAGSFGTATMYLDKAEKKYGKLKTLWEEGDILTAFSLCFNHSCIYSCRAKVHKHFDEKDKEQEFRRKCIEGLKECSSNAEYTEYLTLDLLDLWYFDDFREEAWFKAIYAKSKPKKLSATW